MAPGRLWSAAVLTVLAAPSPALAEDAPDEPRWYGAPLVAADMAAFALVTGGVVTAFSEDSSPTGALLLSGATIYAFDGLIVHAANGELGKGFGSLGMRAGSVGVGFTLGGAVGMIGSRGCTEALCGLGAFFGGGIIGAGVGMLTASVIDNAALAYKRPIVPDEPTFLVTPTVDPHRGFAGLDLRGTW
jgi:hypothetical protein